MKTRSSQCFVSISFTDFIHFGGDVLNVKILYSIRDLCFTCGIAKLVHLRINSCQLL